MKDKAVLIIGLFFIASGILARIFFIDSPLVVSKEDLKNACILVEVLGGLLLFSEIPFIKEIFER